MTIKTKILPRKRSVANVIQKRSDWRQISVVESFKILRPTRLFSLIISCKFIGQKAIRLPESSQVSKIKLLA